MKTLPISQRSPVPFGLLLALSLAGCENADAGIRPDDDPPLPPADHAFVIFGSDTVTAEVADTGAEHSQGLMGRTSLPDGTGMLFVFPSEATRSFWMRDTLIDLDIAFLNRLYEVVDIQQMEAETQNMHTSGAPAQYALEVRQGWFEDQGITVGARPQVVYAPD